MRMILNIAKAELQMLFYSPVAWMLLIMFSIQSSMIFCHFYEGFIARNEIGFPFYNLSMNTFGGSTGMFPQLVRYLYFYIPLLTMGLVSRELSSGSIRLLYSSPITNFHIIVGKYLSMMVYGILMMAVVVIFVLYAHFTIKDFELGAVLAGVLGMYLLLCAYAAIGIFMSSLTSYQIVAAIGTLAVFMALSMVGRFGYQYEFIRDITWWLKINGRVEEFISGMICSEDVLYFIIVIVLFISLTIIRLNAVRQKTRFTLTLGKNLIVIFVACLLGYFSSRPKFMAYYDATNTKRNTLTENSQHIIAQLKGATTITSYINVLSEPGYASPYFLNADLDRLKPYLRFKPEIKLKYLYYYDMPEDSTQLVQRYPELTTRERMVKVAELSNLDTNKFMTPEEMARIIDLSGEGKMFVRQIESQDGKKTWLRVFNDLTRFPSETEMSAAIKRLVMSLPKVGILQGHGERGFKDNRDRSYSRFAHARNYRYALMNQGFDVEEVILNKEVADDINILVIADMFEWLKPEEESRLQEYINRGGNLLLLGEPRRREIMQPLFQQFGFEMVSGTLVGGDSIRLPDILPLFPTPEAGEIAYDFADMLNQRRVIATQGVAGLEQIADLGYRVTTLFRTAPSVWNEVETKYFTDDDTVHYNPLVGEVARSYPTIVSLSKELYGKEQKIIIAGDADCISNNPGTGSIRGANYNFIMGAFFWMSDNEVPIDVRRPSLPDTAVKANRSSVKTLKGSLQFGLPIFLFLVALLMWIRRRGR